MRSFSLAAVAISLLAGSAALAQPATTVQLPTFNVFTVQTTVSVPDGGGTYLGGINRARDGSVTRGFGPLGNRAIGLDRGASGVSVHATIIDHKEIDEALLAAAAKKRGVAPGDAVSAKAAALSSHIGRRSASDSPLGKSTPAADGVAAIRSRNAAAADARASEAAGYFAKAQAAEAAGKPAIAKIYYEMVARRDTGELQQLAQSRLAALAAPAGLARR
jgi:hypothetical protein